MLPHDKNGQRFEDYFNTSRKAPLHSEKTNVLSDIVTYKQKQNYRDITTADDQPMILAYEGTENIPQNETRIKNTRLKRLLVRNCNLSVERDFPLYDFLHKTPVWSLSTALKEELAKYKSNIIQPAVLPLYIFLHETRPRYEEVMKNSEKSYEEQINNVLTSFQAGKKHPRHSLMLQAILKLDFLSRQFEARYNNLSKKERKRYVLADAVWEQKFDKETDNEMKPSQMKQTFYSNRNRLTSCPFKETSKMVDVLVLEQQASRKTPATEIYNATLASVPRSEFCPPNTPRNPRQAQYYLDKQQRQKQGRGQGSQSGTVPFTRLVNFTLLVNNWQTVSYADDCPTFY